MGFKAVLYAICLLLSGIILLFLLYSTSQFYIIIRVSSISYIQRLENKIWLLHIVELLLLFYCEFL